MNDGHSNQIFQRYRIFPIITIIIACAWAAGSWKLAAHIKSVNLARLLGATLTSGMTETQYARPPSAQPIVPFIPIPAPQRDRQQAKIIQETREQTAYVEVVVYYWERSMYGLAAFLGVTGIVSFVRKTWARPLLLLAGAVIILSTPATMICMQLLVDPAKGALPELPILYYILMAIIQSFYGVILFIAFIRKPPYVKVSAALQAIDDYENK